VGKIEIRHTIEILGREVDVAIEVDYECTDPGTPGRTYGPPEDCYPAEGPEIEFGPLCAVTLPGGYVLDVDTDELPKDIYDRLRNRAEQDLRETADEY
jgi:hypothetical protein